MNKIFSTSLISGVLLTGCMSNSSVLDKDYLNIAHRGASGSQPEHTFLAYDKAVKKEVDYLELDLQMTKDKKLVAMHDSSVDRTTNGTGLIKDKTLKNIKKLDASSSFDTKYKGEKVPEFNEVLKKYKNKTNFYIETKSPEIYPGMDKKVLSDLENNNLLKKRDLKNGKIIIQSFSEQSLKNIHKLNKDIPLVQLIENADIDKIDDKTIRNINEYAYGVGLSKNVINKKLIKKFHENNLKVHIFTLDNDKEVKQMKKMNIDGGFTNNP